MSLSSLDVISLRRGAKNQPKNRQSSELGNNVRFRWKCRRTIFGLRAFTVAGPTAWNSLPDYLRDPSLSEDTFRRLLKTYLFALY